MGVAQVMEPHLREPRAPEQSWEGFREVVGSHRRAVLHHRHAAAVLPDRHEGKARLRRAARLLLGRLRAPPGQIAEDGREE